MMGPILPSNCKSFGKPYCLHSILPFQLFLSQQTPIVLGLYYLWAKSSIDDKKRG
jgi:hypothetical protein